MNQPMNQPMNQHQHVPLQDSELANIVLCELKRVAREYTTACLESSNMDVRNLFEQLVHQTLTDQAHLYQTMSQLNMYGQMTSAPNNELQKETQNHQQQLSNLQNFMQQWYAASRGSQESFRNSGNVMQQQQYQRNIQQPYQPNT